MIKNFRYILFAFIYFVMFGNVIASDECDVGRACLCIINNSRYNLYANNVPLIGIDDVNKIKTISDQFLISGDGKKVCIGWADYMVNARVGQMTINNLPLDLGKASGEIEFSLLAYRIG